MWCANQQQHTYSSAPIAARQQQYTNSNTPTAIHQLQYSSSSAATAGQQTVVQAAQEQQYRNSSIPTAAHQLQHTNSSTSTAAHQQQHTSYGFGSEIDNVFFLERFVKSLGICHHTCSNCLAYTRCCNHSGTATAASYSTADQ